MSGRRATPLVHRLLLTLSCLMYTQASMDGSGGVLRFRDLLPENPKDYDKMRPPKRHGRPTKVLFHVTVMGIDSIDENSMTYVADIFFAQSWKDHRLRLPENMTSSYRLLEVDWLKDMWRPDSFFRNAKEVTFQTMTIPNHYVWLHKDSTILYMVKLTLTLSCAMNYGIYPHDTQECRMQMESLSHTTEDLVFAWDTDVPLVVDDNIELPQFDLVRNYTADCTQVYFTEVPSCRPRLLQCSLPQFHVHPCLSTLTAGNFTCLEVVFQLRRRLGYYLFHTYMPTCLIVIMSWVSFWVKPEAAPARVTLGVTSLLTLSTQHAKSQSSLPPVSYLKIIDMFMSTCTVFVFMALMEYALVNVLLGDGPDVPPRTRPMDREGRSIPQHRFPRTEKGRGGISGNPHSPIHNPYNPQEELGGQPCPHGHGANPHETITLAHGTPLPRTLVHGPPFHTHFPHVMPPHRPHHTHEIPPSHHAHEIPLGHHPHEIPLGHHLHEIPPGHHAHDIPSHPYHRAIYHGVPTHGVRPPPSQSYEDQMYPPLPIVPPPPPPPARLPGPTPAQKRRARAILVDRFSRVFFPSTFGLINGVYWIIFWLYL